MPLKINLAILCIFTYQAAHASIVDSDVVNTINGLFTKFSRDFTVLDLTENQDLAAQLLQRSDHNKFCYTIFCNREHFYLKYDNVIALNNTIDQRCLTQLLGKVPDLYFDDFDIVIVPSQIITKIGAADLVDMLTIGWHTVIISDEKEDSDILFEKLSRIPKIKIIAQNKKTIVINRGTEKIFKKKCGKSFNLFLVSTTWADKLLYKKKTKITWKKGISLLSYTQYGGFWPSYDHLVQEMHRNFRLEHGDYMPWNMIIQGKTLIAIDGKEQCSRTNAASRLWCLKYCIYWLWLNLKLGDSLYKGTNDVVIVKRLLQPGVAKLLVEIGLLADDKKE
jgi:hypothetical protein